MQCLWMIDDAASKKTVQIDIAVDNLRFYARKVFAPVSEGTLDHSAAL